MKTALANTGRQAVASASAMVRKVPRERLVTSAALVLLLLIVVNLSQIVWMFIPEPVPEAMGEPVNRVASTQASNAVAGRDLEPLLRQTWFGKPSSQVAEAKPAPVIEDNLEQKAVETKLDLTLFGVALAGKQSLSTAIIAHRKTQQSYAVGDKMPAGNNAKLEKILADRVIIRNGGRYEYLLLYDEKGQSMVARPAIAASKPAPSKNRNIDHRNDSDVTKMMSDYRDRLMTNPASLAEVISASPYRKDGAMQGYRLRPGRDRKAFSQLGLRTNDVLTEINGIPLNNPSQALQLLGNLKEAKEASLVLLRGGQTMTVTVSLDNA